MSDNEFGEQKSFEDHFRELKDYSKHCLIVFVLFLVFFFVVSEHVLTLMQQDLDLTLHGLTPFEVLNVRIWMTVMFASVSVLPVVIYSFLSFSKPGLTSEEYSVLRNSLPVSYALFVFGSIFAYQVVFRNAVDFFLAFTAGSNVEVVWGLANTLMLGLRISLLTGIMFQLPLIVVVLVKAGVVTVEQLKRYRGHVFASVLVIAAFATPPDVVTQLFITVPILLLYELSVRIANFF